MIYLIGRFYVEVKGKRYIIHPSFDILLRARHEPKSLRTNYHVQNITRIRKNQKDIKVTRMN